MSFHQTSHEMVTDRITLRQKSLPTSLVSAGLIAFILAVATIDAVHGFAPAALPCDSSRSIRRSHEDMVLNYASLKNVAVSDASKVCFLMQFEADSRPIPTASPDTIAEYLSEPRHLSFGASMPSSRVPLTPELLAPWKEACKAAGFAAPDPKTDSVLSVRMGGVSIPGLSVDMSALLGTKLVRQEEYGGMPAFEFVLIKDQSTAKGVKPILWVYERITGGGSGSGSGSETEFVSTISVRPKDGVLCFHCEGSMHMKFRVPAIVRHVVKDKQQTEARMSQIISREIEKEMFKSIDVWKNSYTQWITARKGQQFVRQSRS